jgi:hypothetical protein
VWKIKKFSTKRSQKESVVNMCGRRERKGERERDKGTRRFKKLYREKEEISSSGFVAKNKADHHKSITRVFWPTILKKERK